MKKKIRKKYKSFHRDHNRIFAMCLCIAYLFHALFFQVLTKLFTICIHAPKSNRIVFLTDPDFSDSGYALYEYMMEHHYNDRFQIIWLVDDANHFSSYRSKNVTFIPKECGTLQYQTIRSIYYAQTAKYVFFTHSFRVCGKKTNGQVYINLRHVANYEAAPHVQPDAEQKEAGFDYCLTSSETFVPQQASFLSCRPENILPLGYPRYYLFEHKNPNVTQYLSSLSHTPRKTIVWMPAKLRSKDLIYYENPIPAILGLPLLQSLYDIDRLKEYCAEADINLIVLQHPLGRNLDYIKTETGSEQHLFYIEPQKLPELGFHLHELLAESDALITDYSSIALDYLLLDKPIGFTLDTLSDYQKTSGFLFSDPKHYMPGTYFYQLSDLRDFFSAINSGIDSTRACRTALLKETHDQTDDYCKRILDYFDIA